jgi:hypothetical protein
MSTDSRVPEAAAGAGPASKGWQPARALAILLLLVGLGGYVVAAATDSSVAKTSAADEAALGRKDAATAAAALRIRIAPVQGAYDTYAAASLDVVSARGAVNKLVTRVRSTSASGGPGAASAKDALSKGIAAYGAAVERENVARQAYAKQLAPLMAEVHQ